MFELFKKNGCIILAFCFALMLPSSINTNIVSANEDRQFESLGELLKEVIKDRGLTTSEEEEEVSCFMNVVANLSDALDNCEDNQSCKLQVLLNGLIEIFECVGGDDGDGGDGPGDGDGGGSGSGSGDGDGDGGGSGSGSGSGAGDGAGSGSGSGSGSGAGSEDDSGSL